MTEEQAIQVLINIINRAKFEGTIAEINEIGKAAHAALNFLRNKETVV